MASIPFVRVAIDLSGSTFAGSSITQNGHRHGIALAGDSGWLERAGARGHALGAGIPAQRIRIVVAAMICPHARFHFSGNLRFRAGRASSGKKPSAENVLERFRNPFHQARDAASASRDCLTKSLLAAGRSGCVRVQPAGASPVSRQKHLSDNGTLNVGPDIPSNTSCSLAAS